VSVDRWQRIREAVERGRLEAEHTWWEGHTGDREPLICYLLPYDRALAALDELEREYRRRPPRDEDAATLLRGHLERDADT
jgi:hypothetical protein